MKIIVKHKCGHCKMYQTQAENDIQAEKIEAVLSRKYCADCMEVIKKHNNNPKNTYLKIEGDY